MKTLQDYLHEVEKTYKYRIKTVLNLNDSCLKKLDQLLQKYDVKEVSKVIKTPIQKAPLDFVDISNAEVYIVDVVLGLPASDHVLRHEIETALKIPGSYIVVRAEFDPRELETEKLNSMSGEYEIKLNDDPDYPDDPAKENDQLYGDIYNMSLLKELNKLRNVHNKHTAHEGDTSINVYPKDANIKQDDGPTKESPTTTSVLNTSPKRVKNVKV